MYDDEYDADTQFSWTRLNFMGARLCREGLAPLVLKEADGRVLVLPVLQHNVVPDGVDKAPLSLVFEYDVGTLFCRKIRCSGDRPEWPVFAAVQTHPHRIACLGCDEDFTHVVVSLLDTRTWVWTETRNVGPYYLSQRKLFTAVGSEDGILVFGGKGGGNEVWHVATDDGARTHVRRVRSLQGVNKPSPRYGHSAVVMDEVMYVFGGMHRGRLLNELYGFDIPTAVWTNFKMSGDVPSKRALHVCVEWEGQLLLWGGCRTDEDERPFVYQPTSQQWSRMPVRDADDDALSKCSMYGAAALLCHEEYVLMFGGTVNRPAGNRQTSGDVFCYNISPVPLHPIPAKPADELSLRALVCRYIVEHSEYWETDMDRLEKAMPTGLAQVLQWCWYEFHQPSDDSDEPVYPAPGQSLMDLWLQMAQTEDEEEEEDADPPVTMSLEEEIERKVLLCPVVSESSTAQVSWRDEQQLSGEPTAAGAGLCMADDDNPEGTVLVSTKEDRKEGSDREKEGEGLAEQEEEEETLEDEEAEAEEEEEEAEEEEEEEAEGGVYSAALERFCQLRIKR